VRLGLVGQLKKELVLLRSQVEFLQKENTALKVRLRVGVWVWVCVCV
jgi:hypothetical protein